MPDVLKSTLSDLDPPARVEVWADALRPPLDRVRDVLDQGDGELGEAKATAVLSVLAHRVNALACPPRSVRPVWPVSEDDLRAP